MTQSAAVVLFSGGQDSTVCLAWALKNFNQVSTVGFDYGQRHRIELECRQHVLSAMRDCNTVETGHLGDDALLDLSVLGQISETSLTSEAEITMSEQGLPSTFVPGRNLIFLTLASAVAWRRNADILVGGMCETDYSGYPDCRRTTLDAQQQALALGMERDFRVDTPLMYKTKADTFAMAKALGGNDLVELIVEHTHTCYLGDRSARHDWGYGCGTCPACELRANGWDVWQAAGCPEDTTGLA
ncbi:7-cyano-7-deazaguanine synthase QueC [Ponticaulis sp.]|uniref:7-cyano-7-deazaguanine synthase QueC n=1 Tax=Ponticaulis sp. TaxID=2020902 RepID=UPI000C51F755|nr:7-cyano-7-deazaguanine synthase QueC [Ponticaulis sp.]MBN03573.1 7-cyano-7-deazaguanine synthase QueC [Ponticaulis sp.]